MDGTPTGGHRAAGQRGGEAMTACEGRPRPTALVQLKAVSLQTCCT